jgi:hypothetical protein
MSVLRQICAPSCQIPPRMHSPDNNDRDIATNEQRQMGFVSEKPKYTTAIIHRNRTSLSNTCVALTYYKALNVFPIST